ncbi:hypothetical protein [Adhaeretor mobilis]|uniref:Uncharacterized protein n=1 Tax=Adhaeretor mobilis TaxID=1930276 RepID=A0A517N0B7_9BACT|nr:hypothetical protein [Adhaeretor mobilis]QDT00573.1 hypothetical protein HG15A2_39110 [Adhaeretor mobilis]
MKNAIYLLIFSMCVAPASCFGREWVSASGKHRRDAELISTTRKVVKIRSQEGKIISLAWGTLSGDDKSYVRSSKQFLAFRVKELEQQLKDSRHELAELTKSSRALEKQLQEFKEEKQRLAALQVTPPNQRLLQQKRQPDNLNRNWQQVPIRGANQQLYGNVGEGHWVKSKTNDGTVVVLEDGSTWKINPLGRLDSGLWLPLDSIIVLSNPDVIHPYRLVNGDDDTIVEAAYLGTAN